MQKKLADYFRHLVDQGRDVLSEYYEPRALLRSEEAAIVTGLLLSLNVVDCNLCVKVILMISPNLHPIRLLLYNYKKYLFRTFLTISKSKSCGAKLFTKQMWRLKNAPNAVQSVL